MLIVAILSFPPKIPLIPFLSQVMQELLSGVKLRQVEPPALTAPSLTPHEVLMTQIKSRKTVLKPPVLLLPAEAERTARDQIMDFIKSRPRLKSVLERKLPKSPHQEESQVDKLLNDIRGGKARQSLRRPRTRPKLPSTSLLQSLEQLAVSGPVGRKPIEPGADFHSLIYNSEEESPNTSCDEDSVFAENGKERKASEEDIPDGQTPSPQSGEPISPLDLAVFLFLLFRSRPATGREEISDSGRAEFHPEQAGHGSPRAEGSLVRGETGPGGRACVFLLPEDSLHLVHLGSPLQDLSPGRL